MHFLLTLTLPFVWLYPIVSVWYDHDMAWYEQQLQVTCARFNKYLETPVNRDVMIERFCTIRKTCKKTQAQMFKVFKHSYPRINVVKSVKYPAVYST